MEGNLIEFVTTANKKQAFSPFSDTSPLKRRRKIERHGFADDIVFEILAWVPAESLMRFKCVSKAWNLIQHDPSFFKSHSARSHTSPSATKLLFELGKDSTRCRPTTGLEGPSLRLMRPHHYFNPREILICSNHCNGLVCLYSRKDTQVYLYNVTTGEKKNFPFSLMNCRHDSRWRPELCLAFDPATERYKLLHVFFEKSITSMKILTLGTKSWRRICTTESRLCEPVYLNGVIYWTALSGSITCASFSNEA